MGAQGQAPCGEAVRGMRGSGAPIAALPAPTALRCQAAIDHGLGEVFDGLAGGARGGGGRWAADFAQLAAILVIGWIIRAAPLKRALVQPFVQPRPSRPCKLALSLARAVQFRRVKPGKANAAARSAKADHDRIAIDDAASRALSAAALSAKRKGGGDCDPFPVIRRRSEPEPPRRHDNEQQYRDAPHEPPIGQTAAACAAGF